MRWYHRTRVNSGLIILVIGVVFLLRNLGIIQQPAWSIMWPSILIVIGIGALIEEIRIRIKNKKE
ncbi:hypothetical protein KAW50_07975 [candidate division WOR-3 bacterium]|nr:hypothetical protein [candidate division WOR-3 bacterium]